MNAPSKSRRARSSQRGSALFLLLILAVVMAAIMGGVYTYISTNSKSERRSNVRLESTYAAEYAFEKAYQQLSTLISQDTVNLPDAADTSGVTNLTTAPTSVFGTSEGYTWKAFITVPIEDNLPVGSISNFSPTSGIYRYATIVEFERVAQNARVHMQFQREWDYSLTPLFQYAIFYNDDLELFPGAAFNVSGRVHSNGKIYTGTSASITFSDFVTDVNGVSNHYSPNDPRTESGLTGPITYSRGQPIVTTRQSPPGDLNADTSDANHNNDGPRELIEMPNSWQSDANSTDRLYTKAGLKVLVNTTSSAITSDSGVSVPANSKVFLTADGTTVDQTDLIAYLSTLVTNGDPASNSAYRFRDYREGATLTTTNVNVSQIATAQNDGGLPATIPTTTNWPNNSSVPAALKNKPITTGLRGKSFWNGILYVVDVSNSSTHRAGVRLHNGSTLPNGSNSDSTKKGLTVVTPNAAVIVGDYNTGGTPPVNSGTDLAANNYASGYTVQPAAVIADAVTVVSNSWSDAYDSTTALNSRVASNTTINTALISGVVVSDGVAYSGGVENYIRLLETWSGKRLTYYGSMVNVYESQQSTAPWQTTGNYYQAPARNWYFDINFKDPNKLPPGTPILRSLTRGQWVQVE